MKIDERKIQRSEKLDEYVQPNADHQVRSIPETDIATVCTFERWIPWSYEHVCIRKSCKGNSDVPCAILRARKTGSATAASDKDHTNHEK